MILFLKLKYLKLPSISMVILLMKSVFNCILIKSLPGAGSGSVNKYCNKLVSYLFAVIEIN